MSTPRLLEAALVLAQLLAAPIAAQSADNADTDATQREHIARERVQVERESQAAQAACATQFAVTACIDRVRAERRERIQGLDQQRAVLDDELRKRRAAERVERIRQRQAATAVEAPSVSVRARSPAASEGELAAPAVKQMPAPSLSARQAGTSRAESAAAAAQRATAAASRASATAAHRRAVEQRNAERAKRGAPAAPLPVPGAASQALP
jgi:hypothetical protein